MARWSGPAGRGSGAAGAARPTTTSLERLDRNYHWVVHVDARQQELAAVVASVAASMDTASARVAAIEQRLGRLAGERRPDRRGSSARTCTTTSGPSGAPWRPRASSSRRVDAPQVVETGPLVSVVCPFHARPDLVDRDHRPGRGPDLPAGGSCCSSTTAPPGVSDADLARWRSAPGVVRAAHRARGVGAARNVALAGAAGDVVAYLDVDNAWHPDLPGPSRRRARPAPRRRLDAGRAAGGAARPGAGGPRRPRRRGGAARGTTSSTSTRSPTGAACSTRSAASTRRAPASATGTSCCA